MSHKQSKVSVQSARPDESQMTQISNDNKEATAKEITYDGHLPGNEMEDVPECDQDLDVTFVFDINDSFLHHIFPLKPRRVDKIINFAHNKYVICLVVIMWLMWRVMKHTLGGGAEYNARWILYCLISISVHLVLFIPWITLVVLSLNKTAVNKVQLYMLHV